MVFGGTLVAVGTVAGAFLTAVTALVPLVLFGVGVAYAGLCCLGSSVQQGDQPPL